jgi:hypothetical protein
MEQPKCALCGKPADPKYTTIISPSCLPWNPLGESRIHACSFEHAYELQGKMGMVLVEGRCPYCNDEHLIMESASDIGEGYRTLLCYRCGRVIVTFRERR